MKKIFLLFLFSLAAGTAFTQLKENTGIGVRLKLDSTRGYTIPVIIDVVPGGTAINAGLLAGDIILKVNEKSTKNIALKDVVAMIVGEEGTHVKLNVERKSTISAYSIVRGKYKYAVSFYQSAVNNNSFCTALTRLMNDAGYNFVNSMDTVSAPYKNGNYVSKIKVPGAESTGMAVSFGVSCQIIISSFSTGSEVNAAGAKFIEQLKICFPDYYYDPEVDKDGNGVVSIGRVFSDGYESPVLQVFPFYDKTRQMHQLELRINGGKLTRYYSIKTKAESTPFANSLRTIYNDISGDFRNVKGVKRETKGGFLSSGSSWYEVSPAPDGAKNCGIAEGGMSLGAKNCSCGFYQGTNRGDAVTTFNNLFEKIQASLGSAFVYSSNKPEWDMNISKNVQSAVTFGIKKKQRYESGIPIIVLLFEKYENNTYGVRMLFYKSGF